MEISTELRDRIDEFYLHEFHYDIRAAALRENICSRYGGSAECMYIAFLWLLKKHCPLSSRRHPRLFRASQTTLFGVTRVPDANYRHIRAEGNLRLTNVDEFITIQMFPRVVDDEVNITGATVYSIGFSHTN